MELWKSEPVQTVTETQEIQYKMQDNGIPETQESLIGVCKLDFTSWLRETSKVKKI